MKKSYCYCASNVSKFENLWVRNEGGWRTQKETGLAPSCFFVCSFFVRSSSTFISLPQDFRYEPIPPSSNQDSARTSLYIYVLPTFGIANFRNPVPNIPLKDWLAFWVLLSRRILKRFVEVRPLCTTFTLFKASIGKSSILLVIAVLFECFRLVEASPATSYTPEGSGHTWICPFPKNFAVCYGVLPLCPW